MTTPLQAIRHDARRSLGTALNLISGRPGLSKEEQVELLTESIAVATTALGILRGGLTLATERDFDSYKAEKAAGEDEYEDEDVPF